MVSRILATSLVNPRLRLGGRRVIVVGVCVCVCVCARVRARVCPSVRPSVRPSFFSKTAAALTVKRGHVMK